MYAAKEARPSSAGLQTRTVLLKVLSEREPDLLEHSTDVMALARGVARRLGLPIEERDVVARAAELHDIGKMAIPDAILNKPGPLDDREWRFMRRHTIIGEDILNVAPALQPVAALVRASHERWDGKGYPDGTAGDEIPQGARIVAVCDAFSAMVQDRPYQAGLSVGEAVDEIERCAGTNFDPARGGGVRGGDPLGGGARLRRGLAPALVALACLGAAPATAARAPGDIGIADEGNWFGSSGRVLRLPSGGAASLLAGGAPLSDPWAWRSRPTARCWSPTRAPRPCSRSIPPATSPRSSAAHGLQDPAGIALAPAGKAYISDRQRDEVLRLDLATGALSHVADVQNVSGLAMDKAGKLLVDRRRRAPAHRSRDRRDHDRGDGRAARRSARRRRPAGRDAVRRGRAPGRAREPDDRREDACSRRARR